MERVNSGTTKELNCINSKRQAKIRDLFLDFPITWNQNVPDILARGINNMEAKMKYLLYILLSFFCVQVHAFGDFHTELPDGYSIFSPYSGGVEIMMGNTTIIVPPNISEIGMENNVIFGFLEEPRDLAKKTVYYDLSGNSRIIHQGYFILDIENNKVILDLDEETWLNQLKIYGINNPHLIYPGYLNNLSGRFPYVSCSILLLWIIGLLIYRKRKLVVSLVLLLFILGAFYNIFRYVSVISDVLLREGYEVSENMIVHPSHFHCVYLDNISKILSDIKVDAPSTDHPFFTDESFAVLQKYEDFDIWKVKYTRLGREYIFLYTPMPALPEQGIITASDFGSWDTELGCYSPNILPFEKGKDIAVKWSYLLSPGDVLTIEGLPPVPGCVIKDVDGTKTLLYPRKLLPLIQEIYPNIKIPEQQLFDVDILPVNDKVD